MFQTVRPSTGIRIVNCLLYNNCRNPYNQKNAYELMNTASANSGILRGVVIYKGDDVNRETGEVGVTIPGPGMDPVAYTVGHLGPIWSNNRDRWGNFRYRFHVARRTYDPGVDYTLLWPRCVTEDVLCPAVDTTDYFLIGIIAGAVALVGGLALVWVRRARVSGAEKRTPTEE
jgi:hypothetical protein